MAACSIFDEDEVCMPISSGGFKYGLVVESSAYVDTSDEDDDDELKVKPGTVKVAWHPSGDETVVPEKKLILTDRSLMPGDVVRRLISGTDSQRGFVEAMEVKCHAKILGTEQFIYNIDAKDVTPIQVFDAECEVVLDSWVGHVMEIHEDVTVQFSDRARCCLKNAGMLNLQDINDKRTDVSEFAMRNFYPGQELVGSASDYEDAEWLNTSNLRGPKRPVHKALYSAAVTVEKVETTSIEVRWLCKGFTRTGAGIDKLESPPTRVDGENLKRMRRLDCFDLCHIQIGDRGYYVVKDTDAVLLNMSPRKHITPDIVQHMAKENVLLLGTCADGFMVLRRGSGDLKDSRENTPVEQKPDQPLLNGDTAHEDEGECGDDEFEDVKEDINDDSDASSSSYSEEVSTTTRRKNRKRPSLQTRGMKKLKGKRAKRKSKQVEREIKPGEKVPIEIWYTFSTCDVRWQDGSVEKAVPSPELYPIHHLDENEFFPGDFVLDGKSSTSQEYGVIESCDHKERTVQVRWIKPYVLGKTNTPDVGESHELSVYDIKDHPDYKFRAGHTVIRVGGFQEDADVEAIGQVYKLDPSGTIHVWWPNRTITECFPQDLYIISEEYHDEDESNDEWSDEEEEEEEEEDSDVSWETEGEETEAETDTDNKKHKSLWSVSDSKKNDLDELLKRVQAALTGLLNVFVNQRGPFFKNSRQVFQDVLAIFKRCKQMEKILKSSYFDDDEIAELISEIKDQLRKETTSKYARHVAQVYKFRTDGESMALTEVERKKSEEKFDASGDVGKVEGNNGECEFAEGASGGPEKSSASLQEDDVREKLAKALIEYGSNIEDPILQIIFDTSLHATVAKRAQYDNNSRSKSVPRSDESSNLPSPTSPLAESREKDVTDMINSVINTVCPTNYDELEKAFQSAKQKVDIACNGPSELLSLHTFSVDLRQDETSVKSIDECGDIAPQTDAQSDNAEKAVDKSEEIVQLEEKPSGESTVLKDNTVTDNTDALPPSHRSLCIRVCKALNVRLLYIQQEVNRKWLAYKFGCSENATDFELFETMQAKMIESIEKTGQPLSLFPERLKSIDELPKEEKVEEKDKNGTEKVTSVEEKVVKGDSVDVIPSPDVESSSSEVDNNKEMESDQPTKGFQMCGESLASHWYKYQEQKPGNQRTFNTAVRKEYKLLQTSLPDGIFVKAFEDRMDLFSVLILGPANTPYEDGLFAFDIQLPWDFPASPPALHYLSFCNERLNPNLYEDGKVCVSLLGTWAGKGNEVWTNKSSLLQVLVSIQGLILVSEPYFNEAGYEKQRGTQLGQENSTMYNEMAILKLVQSMTKMVLSPPAMFVDETIGHIKKTYLRMIGRIEKWIEISRQYRASTLHTGSRFSSQSGSSGIQSAETSRENDNQPETSKNKGENSTSLTNGDIPTSANKGDNSTDDLCKSLTKDMNIHCPDFPLLPLSKGFCLTMNKHLEVFQTVVREHLLLGQNEDRG